jgi:hypothetical protein
MTSDDAGPQPQLSMYGTDTLEAHLGGALGHLWRWHI